MHLDHISEGSFALSGSMCQVLDIMPALLANLRLAVGAARAYSEPNVTASLLARLAAAVVRKAKTSLLDQGRLWDQEYAVLLNRLDSVIRYILLGVALACHGRISVEVYDNFVFTMQACADLHRRI